MDNPNKFWIMLYIINKFFNIQCPLILTFFSWIIIKELLMMGANFSYSKWAMVNVGKLKLMVSLITIAKWNITCRSFRGQVSHMKAWKGILVGTGRKSWLEKSLHEHNFFHGSCLFSVAEPIQSANLHKSSGLTLWNLNIEWNLT